jgi:hypothetical protein
MKKVLILVLCLLIVIVLCGGVVVASILWHSPDPELVKILMSVVIVSGYAGIISIAVAMIRAVYKSPSGFF